MIIHCSSLTTDSVGMLLRLVEQQTAAARARAAVVDADKCVENTKRLLAEKFEVIVKDDIEADPEPLPPVLDDPSYPAVLDAVRRELAPQLDSRKARMSFRRKDLVEKYKLRGTVVAIDQRIDRALGSMNLSWVRSRQGDRAKGAIIYTVVR